MVSFLINKANDNSNFMFNLECIVQDRINLWKPTTVFVTRIDNWFDDKWLNFSGTIKHEIAIWKGEITIPPFHPNRVEITDFYKKENEQYVKRKKQKPLHMSQESKNNLKRRITDFTDDGFFIWYSGNSKKNAIGALMCYLVKGKECFSFYLSMDGNKDWDITKIKGISIKEMQLIIKRIKI